MRNEPKDRLRPSRRRGNQRPVSDAQRRLLGKRQPRRYKDGPGEGLEINRS